MKGVEILPPLEPTDSGIELILTGDHAGDYLPDDNLGIGRHPRKINFSCDYGTKQVILELRKYLRHAHVLYGEDSRLLYDLGRCMNDRSFIRRKVQIGHNGTGYWSHIEGNNNIEDGNRLQRIKHHIDYHDSLNQVVREALESGKKVVIPMIHSFERQAWVEAEPGSDILVQSYRTEYDIALLFDSKFEGNEQLVRQIGHILDIKFGYRVVYNQPDEFDRIIRTTPIKRFIPEDTDEARQKHRIYAFGVEIAEDKLCYADREPHEEKYKKVAKDLAYAIDTALKEFNAEHQTRQTHQ